MSASARNASFCQWGLIKREIFIESLQRQVPPCFNGPSPFKRNQPGPLLLLSTALHTLFDLHLARGNILITETVTGVGHHLPSSEYGLSPYETDPCDRMLVDWLRPHISLQAKSLPASPYLIAMFSLQMGTYVSPYRRFQLRLFGSSDNTGHQVLCAERR
jgi:hypothetical protein